MAYKANIWQHGQVLFLNKQDISNEVIISMVKKTME
jgi:hypothetical protein